MTGLFDRSVGLLATLAEIKEIIITLLAAQTATI
jgi:hypothetical protein